MVTQENYFMEWYKAGAFADLNAAMEKTGIDFKDSRYSQTARKYTNIDGKQYAFSDVPLNPTGTIWFFNKRIFKEQNLGDPYEMVKNKTWTWDKVEEIAKTAPWSSGAWAAICTATSCPAWPPPTAAPSPASTRMGTRS